MKDPAIKNRYTSVLLRAAQYGCLWSCRELSRRTKISQQTIFSLSSGRVKSPQEHNARVLTRVVLSELGNQIQQREREIQELQSLHAELKAAHEALYVSGGGGKC